MLTINKKAFTLAEVLITLGIIGVIAAMALPMLMGDINDIRFRSQFFKSYSVIQQTIKNMEADDVAIVPTATDRRDNAFYKQFMNYHNNIIDCGEYFNQKHQHGCFDYHSQSYKSLDGKGNFLERGYFDDGQILMPGGSLIIFEQPIGSSPGETVPHIWIFIDVNGAAAPPNRAGYDLFVLQITDDGLKPMGQNGTTYVDTDAEKYCDKNGSGKFNGMSCSTKLIQNRRDYFKWLRRTGD